VSSIFSRQLREFELKLFRAVRKIRSMTESQISKNSFGKTPDGLPVELYTLKSSSDFEARIMTYGGALVSLKTPDKSGNFQDIVFGFDTLEGYLKDNTYQGALVGRYCNRIAHGKFSLNGSTYSLATNNGPNHLHGGLKGFDKAVWTAQPLDTPQGPALQLAYLSKDGEEGFPGNLSVTAVYTLTADNALRLDLTATTDKHTICNLTNHSYFNLRGDGDVLDYTVRINAEKYTPSDAALIPTGELQPVAGTPFDFRSPTPIGARIHNDHPQLKNARGYDQNWVLDKPSGQLGLAARVVDKISGRCLEILTTEPGLQFYTANFLDGAAGKRGRPHNKHHAVCFEPQHFPDSPHHPNFPSVELKPGQVYHNTIIYKFSVL
jgi:aldose 1-epimerase